MRDKISTVEKRAKIRSVARKTLVREDLEKRRRETCIMVDETNESGPFDPENRVQANLGIQGS